jgi:hypothetical protein
MSKGGELLMDANEMLNVAPPSTVFNVDADEALSLYSLVQKGETAGLAGMHLLATMYAKDTIQVDGVTIYIKPIKAVLLNAIPIPFVISAHEFYNNIKTCLEQKEVKELLEAPATLYNNYEIRRVMLQENAIKFRDKYISERANSKEIILREPEGQRKLHLAVFDQEGRLVGFNRTSGTVEINIPSCYYIDFGNAIKITVPKEAAVNMVIVDASKGEKAKEEYVLKVEIYENGMLIGSNSISGEVEQGSLKTYTVELEDGAHPVIKPKEEIREKPIDPLILGVLGIMSTAIIAVIIAVIRQRRQITAKREVKLLELLTLL